MGAGWVHTSGKDKGALGDGWYKKTINLTPYTISTATTGSCAFVELDNIAPNSSLRIVATNGAHYVVSLLFQASPVPQVLISDEQMPTLF